MHKQIKIKRVARPIKTEAMPKVSTSGKTQEMAVAKNEGAQEVFRRTEIKYIISAEEYEKLMKLLEPYLKPDKYFKSTNCSIYYDTKDRYLAIHSMEKPIYKEKIRLRSYSAPKSLDSPVFIEIKKKYKGIVGKRRVQTTLGEFYQYMETGELKTSNPQIKKELDYCFRYYKLELALCLAYDRLSFCGKNDPKFRLTFDRNVRSREHDLRLEDGDQGELFFKNDERVMEAKALGAYPLWFARALSQAKIYPASFSKYGRVYEKRMNDLKESEKKG